MDTIHLFIKNHFSAIVLIVVALAWISFCIECYMDKRDGREAPETDTIDMGD